MTATGDKVYDGRGDALENARLTTADGRMADDMRLTGLHFRLMAHVGRQNAGRGWLRVSQSELAARWDVHRKSVNRAINELVAWGYLVKRTQEEAGESFCLYKIVLDGETDPAARASTPSKTGEGECHIHEAPPQGGSATYMRHMCLMEGDTCASSHEAPPNIDTDKPTNADSPPPPRGSRRRGRESEVRDWLAKIGSPERQAAIDTLIAPIVRQRRYDAPDPVFALSRLADWAAKHPESLLAGVRDAVLAKRKSVVKAADVEDALSAALAAKKRADEINNGPFVWPNTDEWRAVLAEAERVDRGQAEIWRKATYITRVDIARVLPNWRRAA